MRAKSTLGHLLGILLLSLTFLAPAGALAWQDPATPPFPAGELEVWPPLDAILPIDGVILLEGSEAQRAQIARMAGNAILEHGGRGVKLNVLEMGPGEHQGTLQVLLKPAVSLDANTEYTLRLALGPPTYQILNPRIRQSGGERKPARWKTGPWIDLEKEVSPPAIEGEVQRVIVCRNHNRENGIDLAIRVPGATEHTFVEMRIYRIADDQDAVPGRAAAEGSRAAEGSPDPEGTAVTECLSRAWRSGNPTTSFRTCSLPPTLPAGKLRIELRPVDARGNRGEAISIERPWAGSHR